MYLDEPEELNIVRRNQIARVIRAELDTNKPKPKPLSRKAKMRRLVKAKAGK